MECDYGTTELRVLVKGKVGEATNLIALASFMRHVRRWALNEIVTPKQPAERAVALGQVIRIAQLACEARNFEVAIAILEALAYGGPRLTLSTRGHGQNLKKLTKRET